MTVLTCGLVASGAVRVVGYRSVASSSTKLGLLAGLGCFVGGRGRWWCFRACSPLAKPGETSLGESGRLDHDLLTQPVLALCAGELWLVGPWLDYPRTRHHKTPLLRAPVLEGEGRAETQRSAVAA